MVLAQVAITRGPTHNRVAEIYTFQRVDELRTVTQQDGHCLVQRCGLTAFAGLLLCASTSFAAPADCDVLLSNGLRVAQSKGNWGVSFAYHSSPESTTSHLRLPVYGHWCGPGYPDEGKNPEPVDALDHLCRDHDRCYDSRGMNDCACDQALVGSIRKMRSERRDRIRCKRNGAWTRERNAFFIMVEQYFVDDMSKRQCLPVRAR